MTKRTLLYVSDEGLDGASAQRLAQAGYEVCTARPRQAIAILFVNRRIDLVIIEDRNDSHPAGDLVQLLRSIRPDVPIALLSRLVLGQDPNAVEASVSPEDNNLAGVLAELHSDAGLGAKAKPAA